MHSMHLLELQPRWEPYREVRLVRMQVQMVYLFCWWYWPGGSSCFAMATSAAACALWCTFDFQASQVSHSRMTRFARWRAGMLRPASCLRLEHIRSNFRSTS